MRDKFTICVLLYGDFPALAERCLRSITETVAARDLNLRVGLNAVSPAVRDWVRSWVPEDSITESRENIFKYPLMRKMLYDKPVTTDYIMWFDDDSYLSGFEVRTGSEKWLQRVEHAMVNADMIGSPYMIPWQGKQREFVRQQPWYAGKDPASRQHIKFITGGWWTIRTAVLYKYGYPWPELEHCGGDTMLGELCHQQGLRLHTFNTGVLVNADGAGRQGKSARRGDGFNPQPLGKE